MAWQKEDGEICLKGYSKGQQHAGAGVAQVVKADVGQVVLLQQLVEGVAHIVG